METLAVIAGIAVVVVLPVILIGYFCKTSRMERAVVAAEKEFGSEHPAVALRLNDLALTWCKSNKPDNAKPLLERAIGILSNAGRDLDASRVGYTLAMLQDDSVKRIQMLEVIWSIEDETLGSRHADVASTIEQIQETLDSMTDNELARTLVMVSSQQVKAFVGLEMSKRQSEGSFRKVGRFLGRNKELCQVAAVGALFLGISLD